MKTPKEELSSFMEGLMMRILHPYLYVFDIPTGTGKTYSWAKLSATYYLEHFEQVLIFTVQNKLSVELMALLEQFQQSEDSPLNPEDIVYIQNNGDNIKRAVEDKSIIELNRQLYRLAEKRELITESLKDVLKFMEDQAYLMTLYVTDNTEKKFAEEDYLQKRESEYRKKLKYVLRVIFREEYDQFCTEPEDEVTNYVQAVLKQIPALKAVYPQVGFDQKKVIVTSVNKIVCGIDLILQGRMYLQKLSKDKKKRLIIFDESDQCANSIRQEIIKRAVDYRNQQKYIGNNYQGLQEILSLVAKRDLLTTRYMNHALIDTLEKFEKDTRRIWRETMGEADYFTDIFLAEDEDKDILYNRGVFLIGTGTYIKMTKQHAKPNSYICYNKGDDHFTLVHHANIKEVEEKYDKVVYMTSFIRLCNRIKSLFFFRISKILKKELNINKTIYNELLKKGFQELNKSVSSYKPGVERSVSTLFSRFKSQIREMFVNTAIPYLNQTGIYQFKNNGRSYTVKSNSFYAQGLQMHTESLDGDDDMNGVILDSRDIMVSAEQLIIDLINGENTVVFSSATASCPSVIANSDLEYIKQELGDKIRFLSREDKETLGRLLTATYPEGHQIKVERIAAYKPEVGNAKQLVLPDRYLSLFDPEAVSSGWVHRWFKLSIHELKKSHPERMDESYLILHLSRWLQFADVYYRFYHYRDIHSMLYFQNKKGEDKERINDKKQYNIISSLIDGSYRKYSAPDWDELPEWKNEHLFILTDWKEVEGKVLPVLSSSKDSKLMMVAAYNSIKAGCNLQYTIPEGLDVLYGDSWSTEKKDWDAIYVQSITNYMSANCDNKTPEEIEAEIYKILLNEAMFFERGYHSSTEVTFVVNQAINNIRHFMFSGKGLVSQDKSAWIANILEQTIGRTCRTKNKPHVTYIFYDSEIESYSFDSIEGKALTPEFQAFVDAVEKNSRFKEPADQEEKMRVRKANRLYNINCTILNKALKYTVNWETINDGLLGDEEALEEVPAYVCNARIQKEQTDMILARHPTLGSYDELTDEELRIADKLWDNWPRDEDGQYWYHLVKEDRRDYVQLVTHQSKNGTMAKISPESTRLATLMKNPAIKQYFEQKGYATDWKSGLLANPIMMRDRYVGFIGEQAFIALLLHYGICRPEDIKVMTYDFNYELADIVIQDSEGRNLIAFDVKNFNPEIRYIDDRSGLSFEEKLQIKMQRLECRVVVANMLEIEESTADAQTRITGLIDNDGCVLADSIETIKQMVYEARKR